LTLYKVMISFIMTYACPICEFAEDSHLLKLQSLQNKVLCTIGNLSKRTPTNDLRLAFKTPYFRIS